MSKDNFQEIGNANFTSFTVIVIYPSISVLERIWEVLEREIDFILTLTLAINLIFVGFFTKIYRR